VAKNINPRRSGSKVTWRRVEDNRIYEPSPPITCPICGTSMVHRYSLLQPAPSVGPNARLVAIHMKCPGCELTLNFGVPMSPKEYAARGGRHAVGKALVEPKAWEDIKELQDKLKALGYW